MGYLEIKEGVLVIGGSVAGEDIQNSLFAVSVLSGISIQETCDRLNLIMQAFSNFEDTLKNMMESLQEVFEELKVDCESCKYRRTRHGSSCRAEKPRKAIINNKWREKYRPP